MNAVSLYCARAGMPYIPSTSNSTNEGALNMKPGTQTENARRFETSWIEKAMRTDSLGAREYGGCQCAANEPE